MPDWRGPAKPPENRKVRHRGPSPHWTFVILGKCVFLQLVSGSFSPGRRYAGTTPERRLAYRLTDHALGRGARLTQVQIERGGFWVLAQTQPGGRALERRLKQHGATRRCEVCKAAGAYQSGQLTAPEAPDPELAPVVDALIASWRSPARQLAVSSADARPEPRPEPVAHSPPEPVLEAGL